MNYDDVYQSILSNPRGSSGRGMSYWGDAAQCGRLANLKEANKEPFAPSVEGDDLNALSVGNMYHVLHEVGLRGQAQGEIWDQTDIQVTDPDFIEAVRLYRAYQRDWGDVTKRWGCKLLGVEVKIPSTEAGTAEAKALFGDLTTGRLDALVEFDEVDTAYENTGLLLPGPGVYILDHKTAKSKQDRHQWEFQFGLQSITYMHIYNMEHPEAPMRGMIFDQIYKHKQISKYPLLSKAGDVKRDSSYEAFLAIPHEGEEKVIQSLVQLGRKNVQEDRTNPKHCFSSFKPCPMFTRGLCRRY